MPGSRCEARVPGSVSVTCSRRSAGTDGARHGLAEPGTDHGLHAAPLEAALLMWAMVIMFLVFFASDWLSAEVF